MARLKSLETKFSTMEKQLSAEKVEHAQQLKAAARKCAIDLRAQKIQKQVLATKIARYCDDEAFVL